MAAIENKPVHSSAHNSKFDPAVLAQLACPACYGELRLVTDRVDEPVRSQATEVGVVEGSELLRGGIERRARTAVRIGHSAVHRNGGGAM